MHVEPNLRIPGSGISSVVRVTGIVLLLQVCAACRSTTPLPPADLSASGWRVMQGQAVWRPTRSRPELAGEIWLAVDPRGDFFVQFAKTPFSLATAQVRDGQWQIELGSGSYSRSGRGEPPARFVWFQLPRALAGASVNGGWLFERVAAHAWRLENRRTGEFLEGYFLP